MTILLNYENNTYLKVFKYVFVKFHKVVDES